MHLESLRCDSHGRRQFEATFPPKSTASARMVDLLGCPTMRVLTKTVPVRFIEDYSKLTVTRPLRLPGRLENHLKPHRSQDTAAWFVEESCGLHYPSNLRKSYSFHGMEASTRVVLDFN